MWSYSALSGSSAISAWSIPPCLATSSAPTFALGARQGRGWRRGSGRSRRRGDGIGHAHDALVGEGHHARPHRVEVLQFASARRSGRPQPRRSRADVEGDVLEQRGRVDPVVARHRLDGGLEADDRLGQVIPARPAFRKWCSWWLIVVPVYPLPSSLSPGVQVGGGGGRSSSSTHPRGYAAQPQPVAMAGRRPLRTLGLGAAHVRDVSQGLGPLAIDAPRANKNFSASPSPAAEPSRRYRCSSTGRTMRARLQRTRKGRGGDGMANVLCVLYDDPVAGYPPSYARDDIPKIERYYDGQTTPTPEADRLHARRAARQRLGRARAAQVPGGARPHADRDVRQGRTRLGVRARASATPRS